MNPERLVPIETDDDVKRMFQSYNMHGRIWAEVFTQCGVPEIHMQ